MNIDALMEGRPDKRHFVVTIDPRKLGEQLVTSGNPMDLVTSFGAVAVVGVSEAAKEDFAKWGVEIVEIEAEFEIADLNPETKAEEGVTGD